MQTYNICLKKCTHVKIILKNLIQRKKLSIHFLVIQYLHIVHLMKQKKLDCCKGEDCMEKFCKDLSENATRIINYEKKNDTTDQ